MKLKRLITAVMVAASLGSSAQVVLRYGAEIDAGYGDASVITPYVLFPAAMVSPYAGSAITRVEIGLMKPAENISLYIKTNPKDDDYIYRQRIDALEAGWNVIELDTPFPITGTDNISVGYKATFSEPNGVGYSNDIYADAGYVYRNSTGSWVSLQGSVAIRAMVTGETIPDNELMLLPVPSLITPDYDADVVTVDCTVRNVGANPVEQYSIKILIDGAEYEESVSGDALMAVNEESTLTVSIPLTDVDYGQHTIEFTIASVNGSDGDAYTANNSRTTTLNYRNPQFRKRVVCEEGTALDCGWCPRGLVGMEMGKENYPGLFFPISIHGNDDPMQIPDSEPYNYRHILNRFAGFPTCVMNRRFEGDPFYEVDNLVRLEMVADASVAVDCQAEWNSDKTSVTVRAAVTAGRDIAAESYTLAVALLEDGVTGYLQTNYYGGGKNGEFYGWEAKEDYTTDVVYNDLARGIFPTAQGAPILPTGLSAGATEDVELTFDIPAQVVDKSRLHIVAMVINPTTTFIENSDAADIAEVGGISDVKTSETMVSTTDTGIAVHATEGLQVDVYDINGRKVASRRVVGGLATIEILTPGVYVIKVGNDVQKVII